MKKTQNEIEASNNKIHIIFETILFALKVLERPELKKINKIIRLIRENILLID